MTACDPKATLKIMVKMSLVLLIVPLIVWQTSLASDDVEVIDASYLQRFAMDPFEDSEGQDPIFNGELSRFLQRFGEPTEVMESTFGDRTSDAIMTSRVLQYDELAINIIESEDKKDSWLAGIYISGNAYPLKFGIEIGTAFSDLVALLQLPPPHSRAKSKTLHLYSHVRGYWADFQDQSGQPKFVYGDISLTFDFDAEDHVERIVLEVFSD